MTNYTKIGKFYNCNDCGAFSISLETLTHFEGCVPGECEKWEKINNEFDWEEADRQDKEYERYLKEDGLNYENNSRQGCSIDESNFI